MPPRDQPELRQGGGARRGAWLTLLIVGVVAGAAFAGWHAYTEAERAAARRALEARSLELAARALAPGSPLACLDGAAGEAAEAACERIVFAKPETVAAAVAYVGARLALLADGLRYAGEGDPAYAVRLSGLRRAIELDRFGIAAHILSTREGCNPDDCASFVLMRDTSALKANIRAHAFDNYVARHAGNWGAEEKTPVAREPSAPAPAPVASAPPVPSAPPATAATAPVSGKYDFPSAASIPPVSIMNAEPPLPKEASPAATAQSQKETAEGGAALPIPPKRPQNQASAPGTR